MKSKPVLQKFQNNEVSNLQSFYGGKELPTSIGPADSPYYSDVHRDNDNDGVWSEGDSMTITKLREVE